MSLLFLLSVVATGAIDDYSVVSDLITPGLPFQNTPCDAVRTPVGKLALGKFPFFVEKKMENKLTDKLIVLCAKNTNAKKVGDNRAAVPRRAECWVVNYADRKR